MLMGMAAMRVLTRCHHLATIGVAFDTGVRVRMVPAATENGVQAECDGGQRANDRTHWRFAGGGDLSLNH